MHIRLLEGLPGRPVHAPLSTVERPCGAVADRAGAYGFSLENSTSYVSRSAAWK